MASVGGSPPPLATEAATHAVIAVEWLLVGCCIFMVGARFSVRKFIVKHVMADDWLILAALLLQIAFQILTTLNHLATLKQRDANNIKYFTSLSVFYATISVGPSYIEGAIVRVSATVFLVRIFKSVLWLKWYLIALTSLQALFSVLLVIFFYTTAKPVSVLWNPEVKADVNADFLFTSFWLSIAVSVMYTLSDLTYVLFPTIVIVRTARLSAARKLWLTALMLLSLVIVAASLARAVISLSTGIKDSKATYKAFWVSLEQSLTIIITCIPPLLPITKLNHPVVNAIRNAFHKMVVRINTRFASSRWASRSRRRPSFVRSVSERVRRISGVAERGHSLSSGDAEDDDRRGSNHNEFGGPEPKGMQEHYASNAPSHSTGSYETSRRSFDNGSANIV